ncbi:SapC family protein [Lysobacter sp. F60174L2]|uniref:SapC family protein n=1 Tax=Lysobacter sp. F60174L2 TaxID=3459295 RepID=UPI00403D6553
MVNAVLLNNIDHRDLRVDPRRGARFGDDRGMSSVTFPAEFRNVQAHYPIVFRATGDGGFQPIALFGLREGENLFLTGDDGGHWDATCLPLAVEREPFLIGTSGDGGLLMHIDLDSPRVGTTTGEPLFREHGGTTDFLDRMNSVLLALYEGMRGTAAFIDALVRHELLEPFALDVRLDDGSQLRLAGLHTIAEERLRALDGDALAQLSRDGHLEAAYMAVASLSNLRILIERMNRAHAGGR